MCLIFCVQQLLLYIDDCKAQDFHGGAEALLITLCKVICSTADCHGQHASWHQQESAAHTMVYIHRCHQTAEHPHQLPADAKTSMYSTNLRSRDQHDSRRISSDLQPSGLLSTYMYRSQAHRQHDTQEATAWTSRHTACTQANDACFCPQSVLGLPCLPSSFLLMIYLYRLCI